MGRLGGGHKELSDAVFAPQDTWGHSLRQEDPDWQRPLAWAPSGTDIFFPLLIFRLKNQNAFFFFFLFESQAASVSRGFPKF